MCIDTGLYCDAKAVEEISIARLNFEIEKNEAQEAQEKGENLNEGYEHFFQATEEFDGAILHWQETTPGIMYLKNQIEESLAKGIIGESLIQEALLSAAITTRNQKIKEFTDSHPEGNWSEHTPYAIQVLNTLKEQNQKDKETKVLSIDPDSTHLEYMKEYTLVDYNPTTIEQITLRKPNKDTINKISLSSIKLWIHPDDLLIYI